MIFPQGAHGPLELLAVLQKIEGRGALEEADRALMLVRQVYEYWLPTAGSAHRNITEGLQKRLTPYRGKNFPAIVEPKRFGELLRGMYAYKGGPVVRTALLLAPLLYQRPGNLRMMEWAEVNLDDALWTIPSAKMKRVVEEKANGEAPGVGGHLWPGQPGKSVFPQTWTADKVIHEVGDVATNPNTRWYAQTGTGGSTTKAGDPARWVAWESRDGVTMRVVFEPASGRVVTAFPDTPPTSIGLKPIK
ncbi:EndoU domain-containing protein [Hydrogenophaga sp.]|uniref:EndoU domain-containing protein n=1 Tax=Hydrogenophaga sp. TaxID=1904254 RepID=UPI0035B0EAF1